MDEKNMTLQTQYFSGSIVTNKVNSVIQVTNWYSTVKKAQSIKSTPIQEWC